MLEKQPQKKFWQRLWNLSATASKSGYVRQYPNNDRPQTTSMNLLKALLSQVPIFVGHGTNHEGEHFVGRLEMQALVNASALMLHYTATRTDGKHLHKEATLLAAGPDGALCLWPVMEELPFVLPHRAIDSAHDEEGGSLAVLFASGPRDMVNIFREEITIALKPGGELRIAHSWGLPGSAFAERSSCTLHAVTPDGP